MKREWSDDAILEAIRERIDTDLLVSHRAETACSRCGTVAQAIAFGWEEAIEKLARDLLGRGWRVARDGTLRCQALGCHETQGEIDALEGSG